MLNSRSNRNSLTSLDGCPLADHASAIRHFALVGLLAFLVVAPIRASTAAEPPTLLFESSDEECVSDLYSAHGDGSALRRLTRDSLSFASRWSPDGHQIVFTRAEGCNGHDDFRNNVWVMSEDGSHVRRLIQDGYDPSFSPDGSRLAFLRDSYDPRAFRDTNTSLLVADVSAKDARVISTGLACCWEGSWSPDSSHYIYATGQYANRLWVVDVTTGSKRHVAGGRGDEVGLPAWSPDGAELVIPRKSGLWVMRLDGTEKTQITSSAGGELAWSPDGSQIAFVRDRYPKTTTLFVTSLDGKVRQLARGVYTADPMEPSWSPDSSRIAFVMTRRRETIWLVRPDGSGLHRLTRSFRDDLFDERPNWRPGRD